MLMLTTDAFLKVEGAYYAFFLHTGYGYLRFYPEIDNLTLPMLSYPGCHVRAVHWLYSNSRTWSSSDFIDMLKWPHYIMSHLSIFRNCLEHEKSIPRDHRFQHSASLVMPNGDPWDGCFDPTLTLMIDSYRLYCPSVGACITCW